MYVWVVYLCRLFTVNMYDAACYLSVCTCLYMHLTGATDSKDVDAPAWITKGVLQKIHSFLWPAYLGWAFIV